MEVQVDIRKRLGSYQLDVSFENDAGIMAILGASGSGKSMTLKCIAGIETPDEGRIVLNGRVLYDSAKRINLAPQQRRVGYMFQDYALFPHMTVRKNIEIVCGEHPVPEEYYARFHLEGLEDHYPAQLSGGQKQRAAMARMLAAEPEMVILDEPFSALDAHLRWELERGVKKLLTTLKKPALFVSHDRDEVYRLSDMVGAIADGKMKGITPVKEFFHNPQNRMAAVLSGCKNVTKAIREDEDHLFVPGWNVTLKTGRQIPFAEGYVGIRAHFFEPLAGKSSGENCFEVVESEPTEDPFEWNIAFRTEGAAEWIQWKVSKDIWQSGRDPVPAVLRIAPENILLLSE